MDNADVSVGLLEEDFPLPVGYMGLNSGRIPVLEVVLGGITMTGYR